MNIYEEALKLIDSEEEFAFATIITDAGSTPRSKGTKMLIKRNKGIIGTIGGGSMESICIEKAVDVIKNEKSIIYTFNLSNKDASKLDMICGGQGEILIDYISYKDKNNLEVFSKALEASKGNKKGWIVSILSENNSLYKERQILFVTDDNKLIGEFYGEEKVKDKLLNGASRIDIHGDSIDGVRFVVDKVHSGGRAYIFGAGHVSKDVAVVLNLLEFETVVIDDRDEFANSERFPKSEIVVLDSLEDIPNLGVDDDSYILIITRGHIYDYNVLEWALQTKAYYIGMIGSKTKIKLTYDKLRNKGYSQDDLDKICAPIGIKLKAQTPAEIAVSIGAELINYRAEREYKKEKASI